MEKLNELLLYIKDNIPFYYSDYFEGIDDLGKYPIVTRGMITSDYSKFIVNPFEGRNELIALLKDTELKKRADNDLVRYGDCIIEETSGTSGTPFRCIKSIHERMYLGFNIWEMRKDIDRNINFKNYFQFNHIGIDAYNPQPYDYSIQHLKAIYEYVNEKSVRWLHATPQVLLEHIKCFERNREELCIPSLKYIELTGQFVDEEDLNKIKNFYRAEIVNLYGTMETWPIAIGIVDGMMRVNEKSVFVELVDEENRQIYEPGKIGRVIVTTLCNRIMPLLRYSTGDFAVGEYDGGKLKWIKLVHGREINLIKGISERIFGNIVFKKIMGWINFKYPDNHIFFVRFVQVSEKKIIMYANEFTHKEEIVREIEKLLEAEINKCIKIEVVQLTLFQIEKLSKEKPNIFLTRC